MREYRGNITGDEVVVGGTAPQAGHVRENQGWDGQEKEWATCVESDVRSYKIQQAAQDAQSWTEIVTEGGRRFLAERRKEEEEKPETRKEKRTAK